MKLIISICLLFFVTSANNTTDYQKGWSDGYKEGYCYKIINCLPPLVPNAPLPTLDCPKGYKCGYNRGFSAGYKKQKSKR